MKPGGSRSGASVTSVTPRRGAVSSAEILRRRRPDHRLVVHPGALGRQKRPFEMDAENAAGIVAAAASTAARGGAHLGGAVADQRRQQPGRAEAPVRRDDRGDALRRRLVVEQHVAAAIDLHVDKAGREPGPFRQVARAASPLGSSPRGTSAAISPPSITTAQSRRSAVPSNTVSAATACRGGAVIACG